jgi:hypothetical protein
MTTFYLINPIRVGTLTKLWPGTLHDDRYAPTDKIRAAGGWLVPAPNPVLEVAAAQAATVFKHSGPIEEAAGIMLAAYASIAGGGDTGDVMAAACEVDDAVGDLVYVRGDSVDGVPSVGRVDIADFSKLPAVGQITAKPTPTDAVVVRRGIVAGAGLTPGRLYFAGDDGRPTATRPVATAAPLFVQIVGTALDAARLLLNPNQAMTRVRP